VCRLGDKALADVSGDRFKFPTYGLEII
jgi:hypothetical protein